MSQELPAFTSLSPVATTLRIVAKVSGTGAAAGCGVLATAAVAQSGTAAALQGLGFDFSSLSPGAQKELLTVLTDEFDYCGRPLTLMGSLKKGDACKHTKRLVGYAARQASEGAVAQEIIVGLSKYNQGFTRPRATFKADNRQCMGPMDAKVTLVVFSDFECPYCAAARPMLDEFAKKRAGVRLCWAPFPLQQHPNAHLAGQAALFARESGKFWQVHDALFDNQLSLSESYIPALLAKAGLDVKAFTKVVADKKYLAEMEASKEAGKKAGVDSTPSIFINGRKYTLGLSAEALNLAADDELDWLAGSSAWTAN